MTSTIAIILTEQTLKVALADLQRKRRDELTATGKGQPKFALQISIDVVPDGDDWQPDNLQIAVVRDEEPEKAPLECIEQKGLRQWDYENFFVPSEPEPTQEQTERFLDTFGDVQAGDSEQTVREFYEENPDKQWWQEAYNNDKTPADYWPDEPEEQPKGFWSRIFG